jgi:transcriptional regulator CtsR
MFNKEELLAKVNQFLETDMTYKSYEETIERLVEKISMQQSEINYCEAMLDRARNEISDLKQKTRFAKYEKLEKENLALAQEIEHLRRNLLWKS